VSTESGLPFFAVEPLLDSTIENSFPKLGIIKTTNMF